MKKLISTLSALVAACVAVTSLAAYAMPRDPDSDGYITALDSIRVQQFLNGMIPSYNLNAVDVDQNGIVSKMDSDKIPHHLANKDNPILPEAPAGDDTTTLTDIKKRDYRKHIYSSSSSTSYTSYHISKSTINSATSGNATNSDCMPTVIIDDNDMIRDTDTAVVRLRMSEDESNGTGFIVGDHIIATAAHCVYSNGFIDNIIEVVDANNNVIDSFHAESVHVPNDYFTSPYPDYEAYDYALLYVPSVDLSDYGMFSLGVAKDEFVTNSKKQVLVSGFPTEYPDGYGSGDWGLRFKAKGNIYPLPNYHYLFNTKRLFYTADIVGGDSGGPVYVEEGYMGADNRWHEYKTVIGINTHQATPYNFNLGVRITPEILAFYNNNKKL